VTLAGRTDFRSEAEASRAAAAAQALVGLLEEHAEHEDAVVLPELASIVPELHAAIATDHGRLDAAHRDVLGLAARLGAAASGVEREALGRRLQERLARLAAEHLVHMQREEGEVSRALWAHRTDEALAALHGRIVARIPPGRMSTWLAVILAAASLPERAGLLASFRASVPEPLFADVTAPARAALGEAGWREAAQVGGWAA
jgi:hypothetical protein